jgi:hypothetical protein
MSINWLVGKMSLIVILLLSIVASCVVGSINGNAYSNKIGKSISMASPIEVYRIRLYANGGEGSNYIHWDDNDNYYEILVKYTWDTSMIEVPSRLNYVFAGFFSVRDPIQGKSGVQYVDKDNKRVGDFAEAHVNFYAAWYPTRVRVKLDNNAGNDSVSNFSKMLRMTYKTFYPVKDIDQNELKYRVPNRAGYIFEGYWTTPEGDGEKYYNSSFMQPNYNTFNFMNWQLPESSDPDMPAYTLYARWNLSNLSTTIRLYDNNGSDKYSVIVAKYGQDLPTLSIDLPVRVGYTFVGYYSTADYIKGKQYYDANLQSVSKWDKLDTDFELYAGWLPRQILIALNHNGGVFGTSVVSVAYGELVVSFGSVPYKSDDNGNSMIFLGYWDEYEDVQYYDEKMNGVGVYTKLSSITLYARWITSVYSVYMDINGGYWSLNVGNLPKVEATIGEKLPVVFYRPKRDGYDFVGFFNNLEPEPDTDKSYYDANMLSNNVYDIYDDVTLYARWQPKVFALTLDLQGGSSIVDQSRSTKITLSVQYNEVLPDISEIVESMVKADHSFVGFYTKPINGDIWYNYKGTSTVVYTMQKDTTIYAFWQSLVYKPNGNINNMSGQDVNLQDVLVVGGGVLIVFVALGAIVLFVVHAKAKKSRDRRDTGGGIRRR